MFTLQSSLLNRFQNLTHTFTTRQGGQSLLPFAENNIAFHVGDKEEDVLSNQANLAHALGYDLKKLVHMRQIHSDRIVVVDEKHHFANPPECDALITNLPHIPLMVMTADCTPILFYDDKQKVIAVAHAGRAGAFNAIAAKTVLKMQEVYRVEPANVIAVLGPSIHPCCYTVGEEIVEEAIALGVEFAVESDAGKHCLDVNAIIHRQLLACGVRAENIETIEYCSACENKLFFSYRADKGKTGRMAGVIMLG